MQRPYIITVSSEKGGVGKTTLATNLAIYLKALHEDLPITIFSFDNHFTVDQMFRLGKQGGSGDVLDLFTGGRLENLIEMGEYGIQFIPSSHKLGSVRDRIPAVDILARTLVASQFFGVVIIDTRPDLDVLTGNALYAADRVIIPIKDAASLENSRHIYHFFEQHHLSRRPLRILPCMIDSRIRYPGTFTDPYQLLKASALKRGYRCLEGYIGKSPKVESLSTNPEGKIYPILTHGRGTEVHVQMTNLARQIFSSVMEDSERRLEQIRKTLASRQQERDETFRARRQLVHPECLFCGTPLIQAEEVMPVGYYGEISGGRFSGFLEENCFTDTVFRHFYRTRREALANDPLREIFREAAQRSYFAFRRAPNTRNFFQQQLSFYRFDQEGLEISHKKIDLPPRDQLLAEDPLFARLIESLSDTNGQLGDEFILLARVSSDFPEEILYAGAYDHFRQIAERVAGQLRDQN